MYNPFAPYPQAPPAFPAAPAPPAPNNALGGLLPPQPMLGRGNMMGYMQALNNWRGLRPVMQPGDHSAFMDWRQQRPRAYGMMPTNAGG